MTIVITTDEEFFPGNGQVANILEQAAEQMRMVGELRATEQTLHSLHTSSVFDGNFKLTVAASK